MTALSLSVAFDKVEKAKANYEKAVQNLEIAQVDFQNVAREHGVMELLKPAQSLGLKKCQQISVGNPNTKAKLYIRDFLGKHTKRINFECRQKIAKEVGCTQADVMATLRAYFKNVPDHTRKGKSADWSN